MRQKVQGICNIFKSFNDIISKIYNLKTSSDNFPTATYSFKLVVEFGEIVVEPSKTPSLTALFGKIKLPEKEYASSMLSYEYMVYSYGLDRGYINLGTGLTPLSTALRDNLITMEDIISKCDRDVEKGIIPNIMYSAVRLEHNMP